MNLDFVQSIKITRFYAFMKSVVLTLWMRWISYYRVWICGSIVYNLCSNTILDWICVYRLMANMCRCECQSCVQVSVSIFDRSGHLVICNYWGNVMMGWKLCIVIVAVHTRYKSKEGSCDTRKERWTYLFTRLLKLQKQRRSIGTL